jgi:hypothetical protein
MRFTSSKQLNQQKTAKRQFNPAMADPSVEKVDDRVGSQLAQAIEKK